MSTLHKVKAYFGMAPMDDYEDEYYEDDDRDTGRRRELRRPPRCRSLRRRPRRCPFGRPV
jgi:cell division inhibitor SepF